jgi:hypothetical protein
MRKPLLCLCNRHPDGLNRQGNGDDRLLADRQSGLVKPSSSSVGVVIGSIGGLEE